MASPSSDVAGVATSAVFVPSPRLGDVAPPITIKLLVAGGSTVGKTTFIGSVSDIEPLSTAGPVTSRSAGIDDDGGVSDRTTTTNVAIDFGRVQLRGDLLLYLFGIPAQDRLAVMCDDLVRGALGAVVLVDTTRLDASFPAVDYFESRRIPFVVAVNCFDGEVQHALDDVRRALAVAADVPVIHTDARAREATKQALIAVVQLAMARLAV